MTFLKQIRKTGGIQFEGAADPTVDILGARLNDVYKNNTSGELFTCADKTFGAQVWAGSQGTIVNGAILSASNPDLVAFYTMDSITGSTLNDSSPNGNNGIITGAVQANGLIANALTFDGVDDYIDLNADINLSSVAFSFWVNKTDTGGVQAIYQKHQYPLSGDYLAMLFPFSDGNWYWDFKGFAEARISGAWNPAWSNKWIHVIAQYNGITGLQELYVDGGLVTSATQATGLTCTYTESNSLMRSLQSLGDEYTAGDLDQFRMFNRALTPSEIAVLYQEGVYSITDFANPSLTTAFTMDNIVGSTVFDESSNGNDGTFINTPSTVAGVLGNALDFDGVTGAGGDGVSLPTSNATQGAVSFWVAVKGSGVEEMISKGTTLAESVFTIQSGNTYGLRIVFQTNSSTADVIQSTENFSRGAGVFHHVVVQSNGSEITAYVDGVQYTLTATVGSNTGQWFGSVAGSDNITLARAIYQFANLGGAVQLDQVRIFDRVLSPTEIAELYNGGLGA